MAAARRLEAAADLAGAVLRRRDGVGLEQPAAALERRAFAPPARRARLRGSVRLRSMRGKDGSRGTRCSSARSSVTSTPSHGGRGNGWSSRVELELGHDEPGVVAVKLVDLPLEPAVLTKCRVLSMSGPSASAEQLARLVEQESDTRTPGATRRARPTLMLSHASSPGDAHAYRRAAAAREIALTHALLPPRERAPRVALRQELALDLTRHGAMIAAIANAQSRVEQREGFDVMRMRKHVENARRRAA